MLEKHTSTRRKLMGAFIGLPAVAAANTPVEQTIPPLSERAASIISYTLYAEARGEPMEGKLAVAAVIHTRSKSMDCTLPEVCLMQRQFACWNQISAVPSYYSSGAGLAPADAKARGDCYQVAWQLMADQREWDYFTHFYNASLAQPYWAASLRGAQVIGRHTFGYIPNEFATVSR